MARAAEGRDRLVHRLADRQRPGSTLSSPAAISCANPRHEVVEAQRWLGGVDSEPSRHRTFQDPAVHSIDWATWATYRYPFPSCASPDFPGVKSNIAEIIVSTAGVIRFAREARARAKVLVTT
jgi:hypothetical protein